ncbi:thioredoxin TrxC [Paracoccus sp. (in: a-proteobacteria)]|uniref:thioredoxin TrxC n=1 Tax=Paracoccus sp. TaxID=267 RepID=UPI00289F7966|nr:thioredoxin TrxC [Paracoccus sp. (in: a-proteobacteria)]
MSGKKLTCLDCGQVNRVPTERFSDNPKCGTCGAALFSRKPRAVDAATLLKASRNDEVPLVVDFWAPWCGPCRQMAPEFEKAAAALGTDARLVKFDTEANQRGSASWNIRSIPTLALFVNGREVSRVAGTRPAAAIADFARQKPPR